MFVRYLTQELQRPVPALAALMGRCGGERLELDGHRISGLHTLERSGKQVGVGGAPVRGSGVASGEGRSPEKAALCLRAEV